MRDKAEIIRLRYECTFDKGGICLHRQIDNICTIPDDILQEEDGCPYRVRVKKQSIYEQAIQKWGPELQMIVAIEELSELQKALCKCLRGGNGNVEEEIADVKIVLRQLEIMFDREKIEGWQKAKLQRLEQRIKE